MNKLKESKYYVHEMDIHNTPSTESKEKMPVREVIIRKNTSSPGSMANIIEPDFIEDSPLHEDNILHAKSSGTLGLPPP